jgi:hypothetical protein
LSSPFDWGILLFIQDQRIRRTIDYEQFAGLSTE